MRSCTGDGNGPLQRRGQGTQQVCTCAARTCHAKAEKYKQLRDGETHKISGFCLRTRFGLPFSPLQQLSTCPPALWLFEWPPWSFGHLFLERAGHLGENRATCPNQPPGDFPVGDWLLSTSYSEMVSTIPPPRQKKKEKHYPRFKALPVPLQLRLQPLQKVRILSTSFVPKLDVDLPNQKQGSTMLLFFPNTGTLKAKPGSLSYANGGVVLYSDARDWVLGPHLRGTSARAVMQERSFRCPPFAKCSRGLCEPFKQRMQCHCLNCAAKDIRDSKRVDALLGLFPCQLLICTFVVSVNKKISHPFVKLGDIRL